MTNEIYTRTSESNNGWNTEEEVLYIKKIGCYLIKDHHACASMDRKGTKLDQEVATEKLRLLKVRLLNNYIHYARLREDWEGVNGETCIQTAKQQLRLFK